MAIVQEQRSLNRHAASCANSSIPDLASVPGLVVFLELPLLFPRLRMHFVLRHPAANLKSVH
jgi:hypothetical protein